MALLLCCYTGQAANIECSQQFSASCVVLDAINATNNEELHINSHSNAESVDRFELRAESHTNELPIVIFTTFPSLQALDYQNASVTILTNDTFKNAHALHSLRLSGNRIKTIPANVFASAVNLTVIYLDSNEIEMIENHAFDGLAILVTINLNRNRIKILTKFALIGAASLNHLQIRDNELETIEEGALFLPKLTDALLTGNKLTTIADNLFAPTATLEIADFSSNQISHIDQAIYNKTKLLFLNNNPVEKINLTAIAESDSLLRLHLNSTYFKFPEHWPEQQTANRSSKMTDLNLSRNNITTGNIFKHLVMFNKLNNLLLDDNDITHIHDTYQVRNLFPSLKAISFKNNPICDWLENNLDIFRRNEIEIISDCELF